MTMRLPKVYILDKDRQAVPATVEQWGAFLSSPDRVVGVCAVAGCIVSTVFLGVNHGLSDGPPLVFETMVFDGPMDGYQERCSTWQEAEEIHERVCAEVRARGLQ
jgi:hypothetical protein